MNSIGLVFAVALTFSLVLTRVARAMAVRLNAMDWPDSWRKLHNRPVPLWGGVGVFFSLVLALVVARQLPWAGDALWRFSGALAFSASLIFLLGFIDDACDLPGLRKLVLQFAAVTPTIAAGFWFQDVCVFGHTFHLGYAGLALSMLWLVGCVNAVNLLDGMDGSASVIGVTVSAAVAAIAVASGNVPVALMAVALAGSVFGFLVYNLPPATIYLGDAGSTVIGLCLGLLCLEVSRNSTGAVVVAWPLVAMTIPLLDTTLAIVRRKLSGRRFYAADRCHIHHQLQNRGFSPWQALGLMTVFSATTATAVVVAALSGVEWLAWLASVALIAVLVSRRWFGHQEAALAKASATRTMRVLGAAILGTTAGARRASPERLANLTFDQAWRSLAGEAAHWQSKQVELRIHEGEELHARHLWVARSHEPAGPYHWHLAMTFGAADGVRCELLVDGQDAMTPEPWYLERVAAVVRKFGRHWAAHPEDVPGLNLPLLRPAAEKREEVRWRRAA